MKRLILALVLVIVISVPAIPVYSQTWLPTNQITIFWDAVTAATGTIEYEVYRVDAINDPQKQNPEDLGRVTAPTITVTFSVEGRYFFGAKSIRVVDGEDVSESPITWTDDPTNCQNSEAFGVKYYTPPSAPGGYGH